MCPFHLVDPGTLGPAAALEIRRTLSVDHLGSARNLSFAKTSSGRQAVDLSALTAWRGALVIVAPDTVLRWAVGAPSLPRALDQALRAAHGGPAERATEMGPSAIPTYARNYARRGPHPTLRQPLPANQPTENPSASPRLTEGSFECPQR